MTNTVSAYCSARGKKVKVLVTRSCPTLCDPMDCSQVPLSMGFSRQEIWSGRPFPSPRDLPDPGIKPVSPALQADSLPSEPPGKPSVRRPSSKKLPLQKARPEFHGRVRSLASALPHMRHPQGISIHFTHHHTNSREPWVGKSSVFCIRGPEHPRGQVHLPGSESHSPSSAKDGEAVHCPLSQGICMLRRIITSAKGKAPQHRLSGLSRKGRLYQ